MKSIKLSTYLGSNLAIDKNLILSIVETCTVRKVRKDEFLLRENEYCKYTFFVETGLLRQYSIDSKGKEHTITFAPEGWFVSDRESIYFNQPSAYFIQALEDSEVALVDEGFIQILSEKIPSFTTFNNKLLSARKRRCSKPHANYCRRTWKSRIFCKSSLSIAQLSQWENL